MNKKEPKEPSEFYKRMLEAKKRKKEALEQQQLRAEFETSPERFAREFELPPMIIKTEAELRMDAAFGQLQDKLRSQVERLQKKADGLI